MKANFLHFAMTLPQPGLLWWRHCLSIVSIDCLRWSVLITGNKGFIDNKALNSAPVSWVFPSFGARKFTTADDLNHYNPMTAHWWIKIFLSWLRFLLMFPPLPYDVFLFAAFIGHQWPFACFLMWSSFQFELDHAFLLSLLRSLRIYLPSRLFEWTV